MGRLEQAVVVADFGACGHAHSANKSSRQVGKDVTEHVLHDENVAVPRVPNKLQRHRVDIGVACRDIWEGELALIEDLPKKRHRRKDIGLVDACQFALVTARAPLLREPEPEIMQFLGRGARDPQDVLDLPIGVHVRSGCEPLPNRIALPCFRAGSRGPDRRRAGRTVFGARSDRP